MLGKLGNAGAFAVIYIWSAELYSTVVRNTAMGASSAFARIGSKSSPYVADLIPYGFPVYPVDSCPLSKAAWETRSRSLNCSNDLTYMNRYFCMPNSKLTSLVEFCYDIMRPMVEKDYCIVLADSGTINYRGCLHFTDGCPADYYFSDTVYNYPMCLDINGKKSCFTASPECNETHAHFLVTTTDTSSYGDSSNDKISPSMLPIILILVTVLILLCIALGLYIKFRGQVLQVCKERNDCAAENVTSQEMDGFLSNKSVVENDTSADGMRLPETSQDDSLRDDSQGEECDETKTNIKSTRTEDICNNGDDTKVLKVCRVSKKFQYYRNPNIDKTRIYFDLVCANNMKSYHVRVYQIGKYKMFEEGKTYKFKNAVVKENELWMTKDTIIEKSYPVYVDPTLQIPPLPEDVPPQGVNQNLPTALNSPLISTITGKIVKVFPLIKVKDGTLSVRSLLLKDKYGSAKVALFGENAEMNYKEGDVVQITSVYSKKFSNEPQLNTTSDSIVTVG